MVKCVQARGHACADVTASARVAGLCTAIPESLQASTQVKAVQMLSQGWALPLLESSPAFPWHG